MAASYSQHSPLLITIKYPAQNFAANATLPAIPIPAGMNATVRGIMITGTTLFAGATTNWALFQIGDGVTANKYAQAQLGVTATPLAIGATSTVFGPPPAAGVNIAGSGAAPSMAAQSGLTGRDPNRLPFKFEGTALVPTIVGTSGAGAAGAADVVVLIELESAG